MNVSSSLVLPLSFRVALVKKRTLLKIGLFFSVSLFLSLSVSYIFQINSEVSERYLVSAYEKEMAHLLRGKETLEIGIIQNNSLQSVFSILESENTKFVEAEKIHHLRIKGNRIVVKQAD